MRALALALALASLAAVGGCKRADCVTICQERDKVLKCGQTNCKFLCDRLHTAPVCGAELKSFEGCLLKQPLDKWECDEQREPSLKLGSCMNERDAVMKCLEAAHSPPPAQTPPPAKP